MTFIGDANLVGFWPMNEPSGSPVFHNYAPRFAGKPNGVSYNFHVHTTNTNADSTHRTAWPGGGSLVNVGSGLTHTGYKVQGAYDIATVNEHEKCLIFGKGGNANRDSIYNASTPSAGLGFTVGFWVLPVTDGRAAAFEPGGAGYNGNNGTVDLVFQHSLMCQVANGSVEEGFWIGVSGELSGSTPGSFEFGGPHELRAYVHARDDSSFTANPTNVAGKAFISTPIESGRYTHLTMTYEYVTGASNNIISFYKDGTLVATDTTNARLTNDSAISDFENSVLSIGGSLLNSSTTARVYQEVTGWGHLVSGVYAFNDILSAVEVEQLHGAGGLQPDEGVFPSGTEITLSDSSIIGYYPFQSIGFPDVSQNHFPLIAAVDEGDTGTGYSLMSGPFKGGAIFSPGIRLSTMAGSGTMSALAAARSFTIAGYFAPQFQVATDRGLMFSLGSVIGDVSRGMKLTTTTGPTIRLEVYPLNESSTVVNFDDTDTDYHLNVSYHCAVVYDDQTNGVALYIDGALANSGTLSHSFGNALNNLVGSGYPLTFIGGVNNDSLDNVTEANVFSATPFRTLGSNFFIAGRPLEPLEISYLAQSGIYLGGISGTLHDPRLCGYWPCDDFVGGDLFVADRASVWSDIAGPLTRVDSDYKWDTFFSTSDFSGPFTTFGHDLFGDVTNSTLGISSGVWSVHGGSRGSYPLTNNEARYSSVGNISRRYKPVLEERDLVPQNSIGEYIVSFEVTNNGNVPLIRPAIAADQTDEHNSTLFDFGDAGATMSAGENRLRAYLTSFNAIDTDTDISLIFTGQNNTIMRPLVSGVVTPATTHRVLLHSKFQSPYTLETGGSTNIEIDLYIDGIKVDSLVETSASALMWSDAAIGTLLDDDWLSFGGVATDALSTTSVTRDTGLGANSLREIFIMRGHFDPLEVQQLAINGINKSPSIVGFSNALPTTQVTTADSDLVGYYRFSGGSRGSGELDLSNNFNDLRILGDELIRSPGYNNSTMGIVNQLKYIPGPHKNSDFGIQASGISFIGQSPTGNIAPFATSGTGFDTPNLGFSVGMWVANRGAAGYRTLVCYGIAPQTSSSSTADSNRSWMITSDANSNLKIILSHHGHMRVENFSHVAADLNGQTVCGIYDINKAAVINDEIIIESYKRGNFEKPHKDSWNHVAWTYNPAGSGVVKAYLNGELVDQQQTKGAGLQIPEDPTARMITFLSPPNDDTNSNPWVWTATTPRDQDSVLTDFFYFSDELTEQEVKYIAQNGIDDAVGTPVSGIIGGFVHGQDTASGIIGGLFKGQDTVSGIIGGLVDAGTLGSGIIGGFVSGIIFGDGTIGGFVRGSDTVSGILGGYLVGVEVGSGVIAGYIRAQDTVSGIIGGLVLGGSLASGVIGGLIKASDVASGVIGGFMLGGLQGNFQVDTGFTLEVMAADDFDAQLEIAKTTSADFDAKLIIFQDEQPPLVEIIIPGMTVSGLAPPFNQYFIGKASGQLGKTIDKTRWNFGDFTPNVSVAESGAGCYPVLHNFTGSGFYVVKFEAIDSDGLHASAIRIVNAASGIDPVITSVSGIPRSGSAALIVDFTTVVDILPPGVALSTQLLNFDDGQSTISFNPTHVYSEPGTYKPVWCVRDTRGVIWCDSLEAGNDYLERGF